MSSVPTKEGVIKIREAIRNWRFLSSRIADMRKTIEQLPKVEDEARKKHHEILKLLEEMDVKADGNAGWEGRIVWFLNELDKQSASNPSWTRNENGR